MGKYMKKAKNAGELAVMEVSQSSLGVRTRAKTLALQRLQKASAAAGKAAASSSSYLQLRSRRLEKPPVGAASHESKRQKHNHKQTRKESSMQNSNSNRKENANSCASSGPKVGSASSKSSDSVSNGDLKKGGFEEEATEKVGVEEETPENNDDSDAGLEASFGENVLDSAEDRERGTRESTPCSLIRDPDTVRTPGSTTKPSSSSENSRRMRNPEVRHVPTAREMNEFFTGAEEEQQRIFMEKYNFDPVNDKPLPGRFEWQKVDL